MRHNDVICKTNVISSIFSIYLNSKFIVRIPRSKNASIYSIYLSSEFIARIPRTKDAFIRIGMNKTLVNWHTPRKARCYHKAIYDVNGIGRYFIRLPSKQQQNVYAMKLDVTHKLLTVSWN